MPNGRIMPVSSFFGGGGGGGFSSGDRSSSSRGHIVFPTLDTSKEINPTNRTETMIKARWLYNNDPFAKRCADGYARMMGWMMFQPATPDRKWNALVKRLAMDAAMSPLQFDRSGKHNFFSYQVLLSRRVSVDGDMLSVPVVGKNGRTQVKCYEAHQIGNALQKPDADFYDGVKTDRHKLALAYSILDSNDPKKRKILRAGQAHLSARYERAGQRRGMSAFHSVANAMLDVREVENDMTLGVKTRNNIALYFAPRDGKDAPTLKGSRGIQGRMKNYRREHSGEAEEEEEDEILRYEEVFSGGNMPSFDDIEPKLLESAQPHENEMAFLDWKVRRTALGFDFAPELVSDLGNLNGNTQRWLAADTQEMLESRRMETLIPFCQWWWFHFIGAEIASGRLREPEIPEELRDHVGWWTVDFIPPKKKGIDRGREGKLAIDERRNLLRTLDEHYSELQKDWNVEIDQWLDEILAIQEMAEDKGLPQHQIDMIIANMLAPPQGTAMPEPSKPQEKAS